MTIALLPDAFDHDTPSITVIICAYTDDRWDDIVAAVGSAMGQDETPVEIIVVVDYNPALQARLERRFQGRDIVHIVGNTLSKGLSGARNSGVEHARTEVVAFLDDDAVASSSWLSSLSSLYTNPSVLGVGGTAEPAWDSGRPDWFPTEFDWVVGCTYKGMPERTAPIRNMIGSNMSFRRSVVVSAGGFDPDLGRCDTSTLPQGAEETELCIRATEQEPDGFFVFAPEAHVRHRVRDERTSLEYFTRRCWAEGLSKASASRKVGGAALASERTHVLRVLPRGIALGIGDSVRARSAGGMRRAAAIVIGLAATVAGFAKGRLAVAGRVRS